MTDVLLRDVDDADLEVFYEQQREEEAVRRAQFPARDRDRFLTHWRTKVLGNPTGHVQTVTVDGEVAGNIVAWWQDDRPSHAGPATRRRARSAAFPED
jgi:hypothetical protein